MTPPIALLTDFGLTDTYIGVMKGVIAAIAPGVAVVDLTHAIRAQDIAHGSYALRVSVPYFPPGTVFCCVVDPGVGSARKPVAVEAGAWRFVLPDNGLLTGVLAGWPAQRAVTLTDPTYHLPRRSQTFHGRDLFAPVAAHLAQGVPMEALGEALPVETLTHLPRALTYREGNRLHGSVQHVDHFGNLITTLDADLLGNDAQWTVQIGPATLPRLHRTFSDVAEGEPVAYIGSDGFLEVALRNGDVAAAWGVQVGDAVMATA